MYYFREKRFASNTSTMINTLDEGLESVNHTPLKMFKGVRRVSSRLRSMIKPAKYYLNKKNKDKDSSNNSNIK